MKKDIHQMERNRRFTKQIKIQGKKKLKGVHYRVMHDPTEAGTFVLLGATVPGEIIVKNVELSFLDLFFKH